LEFEVVVAVLAEPSGHVTGCVLSTEHGSLLRHFGVDVGRDFGAHPQLGRSCNCRFHVLQLEFSLDRHELAAKRSALVSLWSSLGFVVKEAGASRAEINFCLNKARKLVSHKATPTGPKFVGSSSIPRIPVGLAESRQQRLQWSSLRWLRLRPLVQFQFQFQGRYRSVDHSTKRVRARINHHCLQEMPAGLGALTAGQGPFPH